MADPMLHQENRGASASSEAHGTQPPAILLPVAATGNPQGHETSHPVQDGVVLRLALWVLMGGIAAESILASRNEPPVA